MKDIDGWLLTRYAKTGEHRYITELFIKHRDFIFDLARKIVGSADDADDITQNVMLTILTKASTFERRCAFKTWLYRIVVNAAVSYRRKKTVRVFSDMFEVYEFEPAEDAPEDYDPAPSNELAGVIRSLKRIHRQLILMIWIDGKSYEDAAQSFSVPIGTVRSRLHRAMNILRQKMAA